METTATTPHIYGGEFRHTIDPKGRLTVPAKWRHGETEDLYVVPDPKNIFLIVMPPEEFKNVGRKVAEDDKIPEAKKRIFLRTFYSQSQPTTVDRQGRMVLPEDYCKRVGLEQEVILLGVDVRFEIWNPDRWKATKEEGDVYCEVADIIGL